VVGHCSGLKRAGSHFTISRHIEATMTRTSIARLLLTATLAATAACSGSDSGTGPKSKSPVGSYRLIQVDRKPIPYEIYNGAAGFITIEVTGGELRLEDNGTFHLAVDYTMWYIGNEKPDSEEIDGDYTVQGNTVTLETPDGTGTATLGDGSVINIMLNVADTDAVRQYSFKLLR
jgi:hypothetical protein